jgi:MFS family permease
MVQEMQVPDTQSCLKCQETRIIVAFSPQDPKNPKNWPSVSFHSILVAWLLAKWQL